MAPEQEQVEEQTNDEVTDMPHKLKGHAADTDGCLCNT